MTVVEQQAVAKLHAEGYTRVSCNLVLQPGELSGVACTAEK